MTEVEYARLFILGLGVTFGWVCGWLSTRWHYQREVYQVGDVKVSRPVQHAVPPDVEHLQDELGRAYRAVLGFSREVNDGTMMAYHLPTLAAAKRFVYEGSFDGASYFDGRSVETLRTALNLGTVESEDEEV